MEQKKRWQLLIIIAVLLWTLYNILPTIIFYGQPLQRPVGKEEALSIEKSIASRINELKGDTLDWIQSFCKTVGVHCTHLTVDSKDPSIITFSAASDEEAKLVQRFLPRAGMQIPFKPQEVLLGSVDGKTIQVVRRIGLHISPQAMDRYFGFFEKRTADGAPTDPYFDIVKDRFIEVASTCTGPSLYATHVRAAVQSNDRESLDQAIHALSDWSESGLDLPLFQRLLTSMFSGPQAESLLEGFSAKALQEKTNLISQLEAVQKAQKEAQEKGTIVPTKDLDRERQLGAKINRYQRALDWLNAKKETIQNTTEWSRDDISAWVEKQRASNTKASRYELTIAKHNPLINSVVIDWEADQLNLLLYPDVTTILLNTMAGTEQEARLQSLVKRMVMNDIAQISRQTNEDFKGEPPAFHTLLSQSSSSNGVITLSLKTLAQTSSRALLDQISKEWLPLSPDLQPDVLPALDAAQYKAATDETRKLCLLAFSPCIERIGPQELKEGSVYLVVRGGLDLFTFKNSGEQDTTLQKDFDSLSEMLQQRGFVGYSGKVFGASNPFAHDIVFELEDFYQPVLQATREQFIVFGAAPVAMLECGTRESRIIAENRIDDAIQEDLIKWKEARQAAQVSFNPADRFTMPKPTKNILWSNLKRSWRKYWRGDDSRIIRWGLDLSGGKSVRVSLIDQANRPVTKAEDLKQATSELYTRLNKMGVSERTLRIENGTVLIDFPGVSGVTAAELVKASAMYFHVVNEQFAPLNPELNKPVQAFLQEVWNEAVVTNSKDPESINKIALRRIQAVKSGVVADESIKMLLDAGLVLQDPSSPVPTSAFDDRVSIIARWHGDDASEWPNQANPLVIVFKNYALEGCNLENVNASYDPQRGNILLFGVRGSDSRGQSGNPRDTFYTWTSQFSEEGILGTIREQYSRGHGWRMAVILNGTVISSPSLSSGLRDHAMISGNFSQREVQKLATNLQAGSLSFTPKILSEQNVSPELGAKERFQGLLAASLAFVAVVGIMLAYYRFAGLVASIGVFFNLLIIWAVMQNIEAAITLPAIAGIVLTVAMAVDANVLVFERIREEVKGIGRIASAIARGYQKAFSAIIDSNLTTLIAAFILTQFDCGPVRGFALTLIIGLISSMFTSLFATKYYFTQWAENPKHTQLKMANWIHSTSFDFLSWKRVAIIMSAIVLAVGALVASFTWRSMLGMDFTGGYALVVEATAQGSPKAVAEKALEAKGILPSEIQIRELGRPTALRIQLSSSLEETGRPFHGLAQSSEEPAMTYEYQRIPRLNWVVATLEQGGLSLRPSDKTSLVEQWTAISGQFSDAMRNNAIIALVLSIVAVLIYIAVRFEWKYAISAVLALLHDVLLTLAVVAILRLVGMPLQINLEVIGALMTIIGYSLNDTIIVFDRVREDLALYRKKRFSEIVNMALNSTLSRTLMTSGITLVVLLCLVLLGGASIFCFSFVMFLGVLLGTISSLFIAGPLLVFFHAKEDQE